MIEFEDEHSCAICQKNKTERYRLTNIMESKSELVWVCDPCATAIKWLEPRYETYRIVLRNEPLKILPSEPFRGIGIKK